MSSLKKGKRIAIAGMILLFLLAFRWSVVFHVPTYSLRTCEKIGRRLD